jgi:hypothetical protein
VIDKSPVKFLRSPSMRSLPEPKRPDGQYEIDLLRRFLPNVASDDDFTYGGQKGYALRNTQTKVVALGPSKAPRQGRGARERG